MKQQKKINKLLDSLGKSVLRGDVSIGNEMCLEKLELTAENYLNDVKNNAINLGHAEGFSSTKDSDIVYFRGRIIYKLSSLNPCKDNSRFPSA